MSFFHAVLSKIADSLAPSSPPPSPLSPSPSHPYLSSYPVYSPQRASSSRASGAPSLLSSASASNPTSGPSPASASSTFDSISRTIRGYVPSPPSVSRPVVSGLFSAGGSGGGGAAQQQTYRPPVSQQEFEREYERYEDGEEERRYGGYGGGYTAPYGGVDTGGYRAAQPGPSSSSSGSGSRGGSGYGYGYGAQGQQQYHQPQPTPPRVDVRSLGMGAYAGQAPSSGSSAGSSGSGSGLAQAMRRGTAGSGSGTGTGTGRDLAAAAAVGYAAGAGSVGPGAGAARSASGQRGQAQRISGRAAQADAITWARWDVLNERRILILAYPSGLQIWDCTELNAIAEVLNLDFGGAEWVGAGASGSGSVVLEGGGGGGGTVTRVVHAAVLPPPSLVRLGKDGDGFADARPLLGIMMESVDEDEDTDAGQFDGQFDPEGEIQRASPTKTSLVVYSLRHHRVVRTLRFSGLASTFVANEFAVVVGTTAPPTIHVLAANTFQTLHVIHASALEPFAHPSLHAQSQSQTHRATTSISHYTSALSIPNANANAISYSTQQQQYQQQQPVSLAGLSIDEHNYNNTPTRTASNHASSSPSPARAEAHPAPVFALSHRLLAYASPSPAASPSLLATLTSKASRRLSSSSSASASASGRSNAASSLSSSPFGLGGGGFGTGVGAGLTGGIGGIGAGIEKLAQVTQADVGNAALRVGESVFSGMRFLGGKALEAAKSRVGGGAGGGVGIGARGARERAPRPVSVGDGSSLGVGGGGGGQARFVSRSAPDNTGVGEETVQALRERERERERRRTNKPADTDRVAAPTHHHHTTVAPQTKPVAEHGYYVTVVDLGPVFPSSGLGSGSGPGGAPLPPPQTQGQPTKIDEFNASRSRPVAGLSFARDGTSVGVILRDGHSVKVFKVKPGVVLPGSVPGSGSGAVSSSDASEPPPTPTPTASSTQIQTSTQTYDLYRGRTSAVIDAPSVVWAHDGRWVGVGTRNRTVHCFAVNPYGGRPDLRSFLGGRTRDGDAGVVEPPMTQVSPLARIRGSKAPGSSAYVTSSSTPSSATPSESAHRGNGKDNAPLAFTFISPADLRSTSPNLLPLSSPGLGLSSPRIPPSSLSPSSPTFSPRLGGRPVSRHGPSSAPASASASGHGEYPYQDVLVFDPLDGVLSLRRLALGKQPVKDAPLPLGLGLGVGVGVAASAAASAIGMVTSVSLPGRGGAGRLSLSSSPSPSSRTPVVGIGSGRNLGGGGEAQAVHEPEMELTAKESVVATWDLRRARDWVEVRVPIVPSLKTEAGGRRAGVAGKVGGSGDWLAQGELSTHSVSPRVLPRSLYLSHQFLFHTLGEDYHALLRGYQFDVSASGGSRKVEVRKEVEVSGGFVGPVGGGTGLTRDDSAFIQDFTFSPQDGHSNTHMRRISSSFDEPLASAISGTLLNASSAADVPAVLPMYPNGVPGTSASLRNSRAVQIPMRTMVGIGDGVSEGLGRIRRGVGRVREGRERERVEKDVEDVQVPIPLEFDEEDEDFAGAPPLPPMTRTAGAAPTSSRDTSRSAGGDSTSVSSLTIATPASASSSSHALDMDMMDADVVGRVDEEIWGVPAGGGLMEGEEDGWDRQDRLAIEEAEGYDDLALAAVREAEEAGKGVAVPGPAVVGNSKRKGRKKRV